MRTPHAWRSSRLFLLLPLLLLTAACTADDDDATGDGMAEDTAAEDAGGWLDELAASYVRHYNAGHAEAVAALYAEDAVVLAADGSVAMGREAIEAWNTRQMAEGSPQLDVEVIDRRVFGDTALAIGRYTVSSSAEGGEATTFGGHWMGAYGRMAGGWKSLGLITNYDRQMSAEYLQGPVPTEPPPDESTMDELLTAYENAWNAGDAQAFGDLYAEGAWAAFSNLPAIEGREAIVNAMQQRIKGARIALRGARTVDLGDGWRADGGLHETTREGGDDSRGHYWVLTHTDADGETHIQWLLSNGRPVSTIPSGDSM